MKLIASFCLVLCLFATQSTAQDTVHVSTGWNNIGSVKEGAVPDVLSTVPESLIISSYFGYTPGTGYESTDTLRTGRGYWVKAKSDGLIIFPGSPYEGCGVRRVEHGGISYGTVLIGDQCWMAENLKLGVMVTGPTDQTDNGTIEKYCYNNDSVYCSIYGGLYQWDEMMQYVTTEGSQGICPSGFHVPTVVDFQTLLSTVGDDGNALKGGGVGSGEGVGTNTSGFSGLLAGYRSTNGFFYEITQHSGIYWTSSPYAERVTVFTLYNLSGLTALSVGDLAVGSSLRCIGD